MDGIIYENNSGGISVIYRGSVAAGAVVSDGPTFKVPKGFEFLGFLIGVDLADPAGWAPAGIGNPGSYFELVQNGVAVWENRDQLGTPTNPRFYPCTINESQELFGRFVNITGAPVNDVVMCVEPVLRAK